MKKKYVTPSLEIVELELQGFLAYSTGISDEDAQDPAKARLFDDEEWYE